MQRACGRSANSSHTSRGASPAGYDPGPGGIRGAGRRPSFTAIAEWAADADQTTLDALAIRGVVLCESMFRRTLQNLDADALDDAAGAWASSAHRRAMTWRAASRWATLALTGRHGRGDLIAGARAADLPVRGWRGLGAAQLMRSRAGLGWCQQVAAATAAGGGAGSASARADLRRTAKWPDRVPTATSVPTKRSTTLP
jgi:hypothetical protein